MAITSLPPDVALADPLLCAICGVRLPLDKATAGLYNAAGQQCFACVSHYWEVERLIVGWADFVATQRQLLIKSGQQFNAWLYGGGDGWPAN
jgi:hypothetical protein